MFPGIPSRRHPTTKRKRTNFGKSPKVERVAVEHVAALVTVEERQVVDKEEEQEVADLAAVAGQVEVVRQVEEPYRRREVGRDDQETRQRIG